MSNLAQTSAPRRPWAKPELTKLGTILDVAGNPGGSLQAPSNNRT